MNSIYEKLMNCVKSVRSRTEFVPKIAIVLGSGLGEYADTIKAECILPYTEIEGFPCSTVDGHRGRFIFGRIEGIPVVVMQGRVHYYEGYSMQDVVLPARLMGKLGAEVLLLTNASGSVNTSFNAGDFMLITDHISSMLPSPLIGPNIPELVFAFPICQRCMIPLYVISLFKRLRISAYPCVREPTFNFRVQTLKRLQKFVHAVP